MQDIPLLSLTTFVPLVGVSQILLFTRGEAVAVARNARYVALWTSLTTFVLSLLMWFAFERGTAELQFVEDIFFPMGVDGTSMPFVVLSTLLILLCVIASWKAIQERVKDYMVAFLVIETLMVGLIAYQG